MPSSSALMAFGAKSFQSTNSQKNCSLLITFCTTGSAQSPGTLISHMNTGSVSSDDGSATAMAPNNSAEVVREVVKVMEASAMVKVPVPAPSPLSSAPLQALKGQVELELPVISRCHWHLSKHSTASAGNKKTFGAQ